MVLCDPGGCERVRAREATLGKLAQKARDLYVLYVRNAPRARGLE